MRRRKPSLHSRKTKSFTHHYNKLGEIEKETFIDHKKTEKGHSGPTYNDLGKVEKENIFSHKPRRRP